MIGLKDIKSAQRTGSPLILKAITGTQAGVEVLLEDGEYVLGSGPDDDLQFVDVCLKTGHARIRVEDGKASIAGGAGQVMAENGLVADAGADDWRNLGSLEVITIGSTDFAIGAEDDNWAALFAAQFQEKQNAGPLFSRWTVRNLNRSWIRQGAIFLVSCAVVGTAVGAGSGLFGGDTGIASADREQLVASLKARINELPFSGSISVVPEVDGTIYVSGHVEEFVQRSAILNIVEDIDLPIKPRVWIVSSIRRQIEAAIKSFEVDVTFEVSEEGVVSIDGTILSENEADRFRHYITREILGVSAVEFRVSTANSYLGEVKELAKRARLDEAVLLQLSGQRIEASGVVTTGKLDAWIGFIQTYARRYAEKIPLISFVQIVDENGKVISSRPTLLDPGGWGGSDGASGLSLEQLKNGKLGAGDLMLDEDAAALLQVDSSAPTEDSDRRLPVVSASLTGVNTRPFGPAPGESATRLFRSGGGYSNTVQLPLVTNPTDPALRCWEDSRLTVFDLVEVVSLVDQLSESKTKSLVDLDQTVQLLVLEAALNPTRTRHCSGRLDDIDERNSVLNSSSLVEMERNPFFIRYLVRDFVPPAIAVSGVMVRGSERFIQTPDGTKIREGTSPDEYSKLLSIGWMGAIIQYDNYVSPLIYPRNMDWKVISFDPVLNNPITSKSN
ncbi:MAG: EscD/YscD/HrpQ family type III secretion system periplasmic domain-containing protein [Roseobacter sp.]|uniref:EscD/YscD/HrpQ family type III secretion system periplasmic domain-containing protein n=1 Tax=Alphaproteobacteria TaxID=28211 RepID=UPI003267207D